AEKEDLSRPGAGDDVGVAVAVQVHQLGTEADTSARRHAAVGLALLELHPGGQLGGGVGALVAVDPQYAVAELADEQVLDAVAFEVGNEGRGVADGGVDGFAGRFQSDRRQQFRRLVRRGRGQPDEHQNQWDRHDTPSYFGVVEMDNPGALVKGNHFGL